MKKIIYSLVLTLVVVVLAQSQTKGITYQAVIYDPQQQQPLPGMNNGLVPYANKEICIKFEITDSSSNRVYIETQKITTDSFGIVNTIIGKGTRIGGMVASFELINWNKQADGLVVSIDTSNSCTNYVQVSDQPFTATPFSLGSEAINPDNYTLASNLSDNVTTDATSDIKYPSVKAIKGYVDTALGTVASLNSPALIGVPTAPTAPSGTSSTQLATTEFVTKELFFKEDIANKSTNVSIDATSDTKYPTVKAIKTYVDDKIPSGGVADGGITTIKLADLNVTDAKIAFGINPAKVGLGNVNNTSDADKPISIVTQIALNGKEDTANKSTDGTFVSNSDLKFPTEKAVKTYVDSAVASGVPDATTSTLGKVQLARDLGGNASRPIVVGLQATPLAATSPSNGQILRFNGTQWEPSSITTGLNTATETFIALATQATTRDITLAQAPIATPVVHVNGIKVPNAAISYTGNVLHYNSISNENFKIDAGDSIEITYNY